MRVITNNHHRDVIYGYELDEEERKKFEYIKWDEPDNDSDIHNFFRYKGDLFDLEEFEPLYAGENASQLQNAGWDQYQHDTFFSGIVVKYVENFERVVVGRYLV